MSAKRILVPLDADERSEAIVPLVAAVARDSGATVRLLRVYPVPERREGAHGRTVEYVDQAMSRLTAEGRDDLAHAEARLAGVPVDTVVRFGQPAEEIAREAEAFGADVIALSESPRGRFLRLVKPGLAQRVAHETSVPTLTLTAEAFNRASAR
jgi:nucleotide-binding universal stress UspA family protein